MPKKDPRRSRTSGTEYYSSDVVIGELVESFGATPGAHEAGSAAAPPSPHFYGRLVYTPVRPDTVELSVTYTRKPRGWRYKARVFNQNGWLYYSKWHKGASVRVCTGQVRPDGLFWFTLPYDTYVVVEVLAAYRYDAEAR